MLLNYFKTAWRNILRDKFFSVIKIVGLSVGLTVCLLILLYTRDEVSYDKFHTNGPRIYRIVQDWGLGESSQKIGITNAIMGESFAHDISGIENYVRINGRTVIVKKDNDIFTEQPLAVDNSFFEVFSFDLKDGDPKTALKDIYSVVLSESSAQKYFGTVNVIGKNMSIKLADDFETFVVTGVMHDMPANSSIKTDMLLTMQFEQKYNDNKDWIGGSLNTFLVLAPGVDPKTIETKMQQVYDSHTADDIKAASERQGRTIKIGLSLQPLTDIHLAKEPGPDNGMVDGSDPVYSYILTGIAAFILIIACINFINLTIAQSLRRSKEIGVRKVIGGSRKQLMAQFLAESFTISLAAFIGAIVLTQLTLPLFNGLANKKLELSYLPDWYLYGGFGALLLVTSVLAGFYPSLVLSSLQPVKVLYNRQTVLGKSFLTKSLVVFQFALAIFLIIGTMAINSQLDFMFNADLGYNSKNLVRLDIPVSSASDRLPAFFKNELLGKPNIVSVAGRHGGRSISGVWANGKDVTVERNKVDEDLIPTFGITIVAGRNFSVDHPGDSTHSVIVNEALVEEAGWTADDAVGRTITYMDEEKTPLTIVGVIKNYHFVSLKEKIGPAIFVMQPSFNYGTIWVRIEPNDVPATLKLLESTFKKGLPFYPYSYEFMDDINAKAYDAETKWRTIIGFASALFIFISSIGLLGLVMLSIEQRTKEIGIRKVLGAALTTLMVLITRQFVILVAIAFVIAVPLGYYAINKWLEGFEYRITPQWWIYAIAGGVVITIAWIVTSVQAIRAGMQNPVKSLRSE
ncbi:MAG TPA: ABC transporter permease [Cyclobacteriaceae bacterium]|nr:ABC transporter permease [Cyclobacteriaceae bacterium]